jgi:hypothetical protein
MPEQSCTSPLSLTFLLAKDLELTWLATLAVKLGALFVFLEVALGVTGSLGFCLDVAC